MRAAEFIGKRICLDRMEKAGFGYDCGLSRNNYATYRICLERVDDDGEDGDDPGFIGYELLICEDDQRIVSIAREKEEGSYDLDGNADIGCDWPLKRFPPHLEKKAEQVLRRILASK